jgi:hypothetical protein
MIERTRGRLVDEIWVVSASEAVAGKLCLGGETAPAGTLIEYDSETRCVYIVEGDKKGWVGPYMDISFINPISPLEMLAEVAE